MYKTSIVLGFEPESALLQGGLPRCERVGIHRREQRPVLSGCLDQMMLFGEGCLGNVIRAYCKTHISDGV